MAGSPLDARSAAAVVWVGSEVIVWGGVRREDREPLLADGAAYNPATDSWRKLAAASAGVKGAAQGVVIPGPRVVFWAGNGGGEASSGGVYDVRTDSWQVMAPSPLGSRDGYVSFWSGSEVVIVGGGGGDTIRPPTAAAYNPFTNTWRVLPESLGLPHVAQAVRIGREVLLIGDYYNCEIRSSVCGDVSRRAVAFDADNGAVRTVALPTALGNGLLFDVLADGSAWWLSTDPSIGLRRYRMGENRWEEPIALPCAPPRQAAPFRPFSAFESLYVACDRQTVAVFTPVTGAWRTETAPSPLTPRTGAAQIWTHSELFVWGGSSFDRSTSPLVEGAVFRPARGPLQPPTASTLPRSTIPAAAEPRGAQ